MQPLVEYLIKAIVDDPGEVVVTPVQEGPTTIYEVSVADADVGRVIGRHGRTAEALRTIARAASKKYGQAATVEIRS